MRVASGLHLSAGLLRERNSEHSDNVTIQGLGLHEGLDKGVPFLDHLAGVIPRDVHAVEVGVAIETLNLINLELKLSPGLREFWLWIIAIVKRNGDDTSSKRVTGLRQTGSLITRHQCDILFIKSWSLNVVPLFFGKWMRSET